MTVASALPLSLFLLLGGTAAGSEARRPAQNAEGRAEAGAEERIREVFSRYKGALVSGDGATAAALVDQDTSSYFARLKEQALRGSEEEVRALSFVDRLLIVSMRQVMTPAELEALSLGGLIDRAVAEGWISPQTIGQLDIGDIEVEGDVATARAVSLNPSVSLESQEEGTVRYRFVREDGVWRFGFASLVGSLNRLVEEFTAELGTDQDELIFVLVQSLTGEPVLPEVWQRPEQESPP